jgi:hypothetical protein
MIVDVNVILLVEKKKKKKKRKKKSKSDVTTSMEIAKVFLAEEGNLGEVVEASSILSEIRGKNIEILSEVMAKPLIPIVKEVNTQLIKEEGMQNAPTNVDMEKERIQEVISEEVITK